MFDSIDRAYYERRVREEIEKAENTDEPCTKRVHLSLAAGYIAKARALGPEHLDQNGVADVA